MTNDMTRLTDYLSKMIRNMTRLTYSVSVRNEQRYE